MATMQYVRVWNVEGPGGTQVLAHQESAVMLARSLAPESRHDDLRYHRSDKLVYVLDGTLHVCVDDQVHRVDAGTMIFLPAGTAHGVWNEGSTPSQHWEMVVPAPSPLDDWDVPVASRADVPREVRSDRRAFVRVVDRDSLTEALPGMLVQSLVDPEAGSQHTTVFYVEVGAGDAGPDTHIHEFDQFYLVLEGQLTVEVALQKHVVDAPALVILPAGVAHRQYNASSATERHLAVVSPAPEPGRPVDQKVLFCARDVESVAAGG